MKKYPSPNKYLFYLLNVKAKENKVHQLPELFRKDKILSHFSREQLLHFVLKRCFEDQSWKYPATRKRTHTMECY